MPNVWASGMRAFNHGISALFLLLVPLAAADAANVIYRTDAAAAQPQRLDGAGSLTSRQIRLTGPIVEGDSAHLREMLSELRATTQVDGRPLATIEFNSNGGDVYEGLNIGYLLREFDVASLVRSGDVCLSACALAFLGGTAGNQPPNQRPDRRIEIGATVGFHSFFINPDSPGLQSVATSREGMIVGFDLARDGSALLVRYAAMM